MDTIYHEKPSVLIVDDDMGVRFVMREALEEVGFNVEDAEDGVAAIAAFERWQPDIVLLDVVMPRMDGFGVCAALRETPGGAHTPILMMTGLDDVESINRAYEVGATDFITKPIQYEILTHRVRYMFRAKQTADELRESETRLANAQRIAKLGHWELDLQSNDFHCSREFRNIFGLPLEQPVGSYSDLMSIVHPDDQEIVREHMDAAIRNRNAYSFEHRILRSDGVVRTVSQEAEVISGQDARATRIIGTVQDVTERRMAEEQIRYLAYHDSTTGLPNRALLKEHLQQALDRAKRDNKSVAVLFLDLDRFKLINDTLGHNAGDDLLREASVRLGDCLRQGDRVGRLQSDFSDTRHTWIGGDTLARLGGDEFVIVLDEIQRPEDATVVARRICEALSQSFTLEGKEVYVTASIGISTYPVDGKDVDTLLKHADAAMYKAKKGGRNNYQFYAKSINEYAAKRLSLETALRHALKYGQLRLHYQPKLALKTGQITGVEALSRWQHPDKGMISPTKFIPVAEETGLIVPLGEWAMREACEQNKAWQVAGLPPLRVSVNLSARQFNEQLPRMIRQVLEETALDPAYLELELTESILMNDTKASGKVLAELKAIGLYLSIDDFGTGYSSLSYLMRLPIDVLKIDRSFIRDITTEPNHQAIAGAIISMAHSLKLVVIAEGVETVEHLGYLRDCDEIQGYVISAPLPADEFVELLQNQTDFRTHLQCGSRQVESAAAP